MSTVQDQPKVSEHTGDLLAQALDAPLTHIAVMLTVELLSENLHRLVKGLLQHCDHVGLGVLDIDEDSVAC